MKFGAWRKMWYLKDGVWDAENGEWTGRTERGA